MNNTHTNISTAILLVHFIGLPVVLDKFPRNLEPAGLEWARCPSNNVQPLKAIQYEHVQFDTKLA